MYIPLESWTKYKVNPVQGGAFYVRDELLKTCINQNLHNSQLIFPLEKNVKYEDAGT